MRRQGKVDVPLAIVSLLLGVGIWLYAQSQEHLKVPKTFNFEVFYEWESLADNLVVTSRPDTVQIKFEGTKEDFDALTEADISRAWANVNLSNVELGENRLRVTPQFSDKSVFSRLSHEAAFVDLVVEERLTVTRDVSVVAYGDPPSGLQYDDAVVEPPRVEISGSSKDLAKVTKAQVQLDLSRAETGIIQRLQVQLLNKEGRQIPVDSRVVGGSALSIQPYVVSVTPSFRATEPRRSVLVSPNLIGQVKEGFKVAAVQVNPNQLMVSGERRALSNLTVVSTKPIRLDGLDRTTTLSADVILPSGVRAVNSTRVSVRVTLEALPVAKPPETPPGSGGTGGGGTGGG